MNNRIKLAEDRFNRKFTRIFGGDSGNNPCWEWTAGKFTDGYGCFHFEGKEIGAHRVAWMLHNGPIPEDRMVCHTCDNPGCVNPSHLFLGTATDNNHDRDRKGRGHKHSREHYQRIQKLSAAARVENNRGR